MATKSAIQIYWDSNAFLGLINEEADKAAECDEVWHEAQQGTYVIVTSTLTLAEVIYMKGTPRLDPAKRDRVTNFFRSNWIVLSPVTRRIAELARDVVWDNGIKPKDAVHVATAAAEKIARLHTFDGELLNKRSAVVEGFTVTFARPRGTGSLPLPFTP